MSEEKEPINMHGHDLHVQDEDRESIKHVLKSWKDHPDDFKDMRHALEKDPNKKIYIGHDVLEIKNGKTVLRKSSQF